MLQFVKAPSFMLHQVKLEAGAGLPPKGCRPALSSTEVPGIQHASSLIPLPATGRGTSTRIKASIEMCFASESVQEENTLMKDKKVAGCSPTGPKEETEVAEG